MTAAVPPASPPLPRTLATALPGPFAGLPITLDDHDPGRGAEHGRPFLLLHGGGGPRTVAAFSRRLAERTGSRVLVPTHPGFAGTPRPDGPASTRDLAAAYAALLDESGLSGVTVVGNSFGGWLAAEIALLGAPRVRGAVIVSGIGIEVEGHPVTDVRGLSPADLRALSFHDPDRAPGLPAGGSGPSPDLQALIAYTGGAMADPTLRGRLGGLDLPVHVVWGESDGIVGPGYGRAYAASIPRAAFTLLARTGHLPQVETPEALLAAIVQGPGGR